MQPANSNSERKFRRSSFAEAVNESDINLSKLLP